MGKKTRQTEEEVGRQHQGMNRPGVRQVPEGSGEQGKMEKAGSKIICGAPTTLAVKGLMMMMMMMYTISSSVCLPLRHVHTQSGFNGIWLHIAAIPCTCSHVLAHCQSRLTYSSRGARYQGYAHGSPPLIIYTRKEKNQISDATFGTFFLCGFR